MIYDPIPRYFDPQPKRLSLIQRVGRILGQESFLVMLKPTPTFSNSELQLERGRKWNATNI